MLTSTYARRVAGVAGVLGGLAWVAFTVAEARLPQGCVGDECLTRPQRPDSTLANVLLAVGLVLVAVCGLAVLAELRAGRQLGRLGTVGAVGLAVGFGLLAAAGVVGHVTDDQWSGMPALVLPGVVGLAVGLLALGLAVLRSRLFPAWAGVLLVIGAVLLPFGDQENSTILRDIPFGLAWVVVGVLMARGAQLGGRAPAVAPAPVASSRR